MGAQGLGGGGQAGVDGALGADEQDVGHAGGQAGHQRGGVSDHLDPADEGQGDQPGGDVVPDPPTLVVHPDGGAVTGPRILSSITPAPRSPVRHAVRVRFRPDPPGRGAGRGLPEGNPAAAPVAPRFRVSPPPGSGAT